MNPFFPLVLVNGVAGFPFSPNCGGAPVPRDNVAEADVAACDVDDMMMYQLFNNNNNLNVISVVITGGGRDQNITHLIIRPCPQKVKLMHDASSSIQNNMCRKFKCSVCKCNSDVVEHDQAAGKTRMKIKNSFCPARVSPLSCSLQFIYPSPFL